MADPERIMVQGRQAHLNTPTVYGGGMYPMYLSTLPAESVPPRIAGTAVAIPTGIGETLGATLMPVIAGKLTDIFNDLFAPMWMAALAGVSIAFISLFYVETAPQCVARMKHKPTQNDRLLKAFRQEQSTAIE